MIGKLLLSIWLILWGLAVLIPALTQFTIVLAALALVAGVLLLVDK